MTKIKIIRLCALALSASVMADNITLVLSGEEENGKSKICEYSNSIYDFTYTVKNYQDCPHTRTFDSDSSN